MDNMRDLTMVLISLSLFFSFAATVTGKTTLVEKDPLPIQIFFNPSKSIDKLMDSKSEGNLIKSENKEFQLNIRSDDDDEGKIDLIIAATKEVKSTDTSIDKYSPKYNVEPDIPNKVTYSDKKSDPSNRKAFETSRQDQSTLYQTSLFSEIDPFASKQKASDLPQPFLFGENKFSPLENLRHLEENLEREMHPRSLGQTLSNLQYANNEVPYGMMVTQPMYSSAYAPTFNSASLYGVTHSQNPQPYYHMGAPEQAHVIQNTPMHRHHLLVNAPQSKTPMNPHYGYINPLHYPTNPDPQPQFSVKELSRDPRYNSESGLRTNSPEQQVLHQFSGKPEYHPPHNAQYPLINMHKEHSVHGNSPDSNQHNEHLPQNNRIQIGSNNYHSNKYHPLKDEVHDRNLYYTPVTDKHQVYEQRHPTHTSDEIRRPIDYQHLHRTRIIPQGHLEAIHGVNKHPNMMGLNSQRPLSSPRVQHVPHYTVVPQNMLPKYLQTPVYSNTQQIPHSSVNDMNAHTSSQERPRFQQEPHSYNDQHYRVPQDQTNPRYKLEEMHMGPPPEPYLPEAHRRYPTQKEHSVPSNYVNSLNHQKEYSVPSRHVHHHDQQNDHSISSHSDQTRDHRNEYSVVPSHHVNTRDSQRDYSGLDNHVQLRDSANPEEYRNKAEDNQLKTPKRRKKYKHGNLPYKREMEKSRKDTNSEDLDSRSSHQYVIKIG